MTKERILILLLSSLPLFTLSSFGQKVSEPSSQIDTPFLVGIRLSDSVIIPWGTTFNNLIKHGSPTITKRHKIRSANWDTVEIISGIKSTLFTNEINAGYGIYDTLGNLIKTDKVIFYFATFNSKDWETLKERLTKALGNPTNTRPRRFRSYLWSISKTYISISKKRHNKSYLTIRRHSM